MSKWGILPLAGILWYWYLAYTIFDGLVHSTAILVGITNLVVLIALILVGIPITISLGMISLAIFDNFDN